MKPVRHPAAPCARSSRGNRLPSHAVGRACIILLLLAVCLTPAPLAGAPPGTIVPLQITDASPVRISQIYGGGGLANAPYQNDFIELHNTGQTAVDVTGWSIQYFGSTQSGPAFRIDLSGVIPAGGYYLAAGRSSNGCNSFTAPCGVPLPAVDAANLTLNISNTNAMVYLVNYQDTIQGYCRPDIAPLDMVGYGSGVLCYEGDDPAPAATNTTALIREGDGCQDEDQNATDFFTAAPIPRNTAAPAVICAPQAVTLATWEAHVKGDGVQLTWTTVSEIENAGFNIYRSSTATGPWAQLNATLIPAQTPGAAAGAQYTWTDEVVEAGMTYWYTLEDIALDGTPTRHEPAAVMMAGPNSVGLSSAHASRESSLPLWLFMTAALGLAVVGFRLLIQGARQS
jgi:hypothetical protein